MANDALKQMMTQLFEDKDGNGVPDAFEQKSADGKTSFQVFSTDKVNVNGKEYNNIDELPPEVKEKMKQAFSMLSKNKWMGKVASTALNFMPEMNIGLDKQATATTDKPITSTSSSPYSGTPVDMSSGKSNFSIPKKWVYAALLIVVFFLVWFLKKGK